MSVSARDSSHSDTLPRVSRTSFGKLENGEEIEQITLTNGRNLTVQVLTWGGIIRTINMPDRNGVVADIVLGYDQLKPYEARHPYFGTITGRFANRIAHGVFTLDGVRYTLAQNNGPNHLHGGLEGFDRKVWRADTSSTADGARVRLTAVSSDGDQGYPGEVSAEVTYTLTTNNELRIDYSATTTKPTPLNLTNHSYFNLAGHDAGSILDHSLRLFANEYIPVDDSQIPTGALTSVMNSPFDFTSSHTIGERINKVGIGYDHTFVVSGTTNTLRPVALVMDPHSGRTLEVFSTKPGVQLYTGNHLHHEKGKNGAVYEKHAGFCLETQYYPDSVNQPKFPSSILRPGERYAHSTVFAFSVLPRS